MERLILASGITAVLLALLLTPSASPVASPPGGASPVASAPGEFKAAGVCARCHGVSVLEWGISKHVAEKTTCQKCHGPSKEHVANERNEVKPDRLPRGAQIAKT